MFAQDEAAMLLSARAHVSGAQLVPKAQVLLYTAALLGFVTVVDCLAAAADIDVNWRNPSEAGNTALHAAAIGGHFAVVKALLTGFADRIKPWVMNERRQQALDFLSLAMSTAQRAQCLSMLRDANLDDGGSLSTLSVSDAACVNATVPAPHGNRALWLWQTADGGTEAFPESDAEHLDIAFSTPFTPQTISLGAGVVDLDALTVDWGDGLRCRIRRVGPTRPTECSTPPSTPTETSKMSASTQEPTIADAEQAVRSDDVTALQRYIEHGGDPNATVLPSGCTLLYIACRGGRLTAARYLVEVARADVNLASGQVQSTPLHGACYGGHPDVVEMLVRNGADTAKKNKHGHTPEYDAKHPDQAAQNENGSKARLDTCVALLQQSACESTRASKSLSPHPLSLACGVGDCIASVAPPAISHDPPPALATDHLPKVPASAALADAIKSNNVDAVVVYLNQEGDPNAVVPSRQNHCLLCLAAMWGMIEIAQALVERSKGADVNRPSGPTGDTPLHAACLSGSAAVVELLLENGASPDPKNKDGRTPAQLLDARCEGSIGCQALIDAARREGGTPRTRFERRIAADEGDVSIRLEFARYLSEDLGNHLEALEQLMRAVAMDPQSVAARLTMARVLDAEGRHSTAAVVAHVGVTIESRLLLASATAMCGVLRTSALASTVALMRQAAPGAVTSQCDCIDAFAALDQYLVAFSGDPNAPVPTEDGHTLLYLAACSGYVGLVLRLLSDHRTVVSKRSRSSRSTALHGACAAGHATVVRLLLKRQADTGALNAAKQTPRDVAVAAGANDCVELLDVHVADPHAASVLLPMPVSATVQVPTAKPVSSFAELLDRKTSGQCEFKRPIFSDQSILRLEYMCMSCALECRSFSDFFGHTTTDACAATSQSGHYALRVVSTGVRSEELAIPELEEFSIDRRQNVVMIYNALCTVLQDFIPKLAGSSQPPSEVIVRCLLEKRSGPKRKKFETVRAVKTFSELQVMADKNTTNYDFRRVVAIASNEYEVRLEYLCTGCRCKKTKKPTKCTTFANFFDHVTNTKCVATGLGGVYNLHLRVESVATDESVELDDFKVDRSTNVVILYNALCKVLHATEAKPKDGAMPRVTTIQCLLNRRGGSTVAAEQPLHRGMDSRALHSTVPHGAHQGRQPFLSCVPPPPDYSVPRPPSTVSAVADFGSGIWARTVTDRW